MKKIMKKTLIFLSIYFLATNIYADSKEFPVEGTIPYLGLDDTSDPLQVKDGRAADIQNITLNLDGTADKRYGNSLKNETLDTNDLSDSFEPVTGLYELRLSSGTNYLIATCANKIFYDNSGIWADITGGLTALITEGQNNQFTWTTALDNAIGTNEVDAPIRWTGTGNATTVSWTGLTNPIQKAKCIVWWKNYLIFGNTTENGTAYTTRIRWSNVGTIGTWTNADYVDIATQGGQQIEGFGILYDNLIIFLTNSIYKVSLVGGSELILVTKISEGVGCIAKNSIQNVWVNNTETLIFLSKDGTINQFDGTNIKEISLLIHVTLDNFKTSRLQYATSGNLPRTSHYFLSLTNTNAGTTNNLLLDFFYDTGEWSKHTGIEANAMCIADDADGLPQIYFGNYKSFVYQLNDENKLDDVFGFSGVFDSKDITDTATASGRTILYDTSFAFYDILLLHYNGVDGSINFIDEGEHILTAYGDTQIDTAQQKFGIASGLFDGSGDYLSSVDSVDWSFGTGDFTIDCWVRFNSLTGTQAICGQYASNSDYWYVSKDTSNKLEMQFVAGGSNIGTYTTSSAYSFSTATWYHIAFVRNSTTGLIFVNGVSQALTETNAFGAGNVGNVAAAFEIGRFNVASYIDGWMDELRISKGTARWTSSFTVATSAMIGSTLRIISGAGEDDELLVCASTTSGIIVTDTTAATTNSEYDLGKINSYFVTKWYSFGSPIRRKNFQDLYLWTTKKSTATLNLYYASDEISTIETKNLNDYDTDSLWGTTMVSGETVIWSGEEFSISKIPLNISGRFIKTKFEEDGIGESMSLHSYLYLYEDLDIR